MGRGEPTEKSDEVKVAQEQFDELFERFTEELDSFYGGRKASCADVRKTLQQIKATAQTLRNGVLEDKKGPSKKAKSKVTTKTKKVSKKKVIKKGKK